DGSGDNNNDDEGDSGRGSSNKNNKGGTANAQNERRRKRKHAFEVLKRRVTEARIGIPVDPPPPTIHAFRRPDGTADYVGYACSLAKHYADTQLQHKLDYRHSSDDPCKLDKFLMTLQRLVEVSAPYQRLLVWLYRLARWDNPRLSLWWCCVYFMLLFTGTMTAFLWMLPVFVTAYYRLRPNHAHNWLALDRPGTSIIPNKVLLDASAGTLAKGLVANRLWDLWRETLGAHVHIYLADLADWMERAKNGATWQRPWASRVLMLVFTCMALFVYFVPAGVLQRMFGVCIGVQFFFLAPLQLRYERYRRMLWVVDCLLWHCPTDVELAMDTLYTQSLQRKDGHGRRKHGHRRTRSQDSHASGTHYGSDEDDDDDERTEEASRQTVARGPREYVRRMYKDMMYAYNPLTKRRYPPVMILQTASSASLDRLGDETDDSTDITAVHEALSAGRRLGKRILGATDAAFEDDRYTGIGGNTDDAKSYHLPSVMGPGEEKEWMKQAGLFKPISRAYSVD
ncbi:hypothetical protein IW150_006928, partial [Coemansia sp. RSA 2607]